jgi:hypothetical protein
MKAKRLLMSTLLLFGVLLGREAQAFYNPSTGRGLSRDPLGEMAFFKDYVRGKPQPVAHKISKESLMPPYLFVRNVPADRIDVLGLESEPDVSWAPASCPKPERFSLKE